MCCPPVHRLGGCPETLKPGQQVPNRALFHVSPRARSGNSLFFLFLAGCLVGGVSREGIRFELGFEGCVGHAWGWGMWVGKDAFGEGTFCTKAWQCGHSRLEARWRHALLQLACLCLTRCCLGGLAAWWIGTCRPGVGPGLRAVPGPAAASAVRTVGREEHLGRELAGGLDLTTCPEIQAAEAWTPPPCSRECVWECVHVCV